MIIKTKHFETEVPKELHDQFCDFIANEVGLYFPKDTDELEKKLHNITHHLGYKDLVECMQRLIQNKLTKEQIVFLAKALTIGETYFFRDKKSFAALREKILPALIHKKHQQNKKIKIWSAACATGEEAFSIAILLHQLLPDISNWHIEILATDINENFLEKAKAAEYKKWSFRATPEEIKERYFTLVEEGAYTLIPEIKKMVNFSYLNLAGQNYVEQQIHDIDIIFCNNVLIYFSPQQIQKTIEKLTDALAINGWLIVTSIEVPYVLDARLKAVQFDGAVCFKKTDILTEEEKKFTFGIHATPKVTALAPFMHPPKETLEVPIKEERIIEKPKKEVVVKKDDSFKTLLKLYQEGQYQEIITHLEEDLAKLKSIKHLEKVILLIKSYANQGNLKLAEKWCDAALNSEKLNPLLYFLKATISQELGLDHQAIQFFKHALFLDPEFIMSYFSLGMLSLKKGDQQDAHKCFKNALELLKGMKKEQELLGTDGMTAGQLKEMIQSIT